MMSNDWGAILRVVLAGSAAYLAIIAVLRFSGKRTLAKMNAFDLVVTVALGSILATTALSDDVTVLMGLTAFTLLVLLQYVIAALSVRWRWVNVLAKSDARTLLIDGVIDKIASREERVSTEELHAAVRGAGYGDLAEIAAIII